MTGNGGTRKSRVPLEIRLALIKVDIQCRVVVAIHERKAQLFAHLLRVSQTPPPHLRLFAAAQLLNLGKLNGSLARCDLSAQIIKSQRQPDYIRSAGGTG